MGRMTADASGPAERGERQNPRFAVVHRRPDLGESGGEMVPDPVPRRGHLDLTWGTWASRLQAKWTRHRWCVTPGTLARERRQGRHAGRR